MWRKSVTGCAPTRETIKVLERNDALASPRSNASIHPHALVLNTSFSGTRKRPDPRWFRA